MTKRPSFQFYPGDWKSNANLRRCSPAARGVWMDVLGVLHDSDEYGVVRWPLKELARAAGAAMPHVKELVEKFVLKGSDSLIEAFIYTPRSGRRDGAPVTLIPAQQGPIWFSSRMVKDEYVRLVRGEGGKDTRFGADNDASNTSPKPGKGDGASSSSSSPSSKVRSDDEGARPVLDRICEILRVDLKADPTRVTWLRQVEEMMRDGLDPPRIFEATEIARTHGKLNLAYIRAVAFNPPKPQEKANGHSNRKESQHEQRARIIAEDHAGDAPPRHGVADQSEDHRPRAALSYGTDDRR